MGANVEVKNVNKIFKGQGKDVIALRDINLEIPAGQFVCLLGPSGCGKSTLLNAIAGFSPPTSGEVKVAGQLIVSPGPDRGMVFQEYALFPWMTVEDNISFGLRLKKTNESEIQQTVDRLLATLKLTE